MDDLLGSILGTMEKPPVISNEDRKRKEKQKKQYEDMKSKEKETLNTFRDEIQTKVKGFIDNAKEEKLKFTPMDRVHRAIVHEVGEDAGLTSFAFGKDEHDRYCYLWKKDYAPCDDQLAALRNGEEWDPVKFKEKKKLIEEEEQMKQNTSGRIKTKIVPHHDYKDKYKHIIGEACAKEAAQDMVASVSYGNVPSENKRDLRSIEQVMADTKSRKKMKLEHASDLAEGLTES